MQKPHTLTISDYDSKTHAFHYEFTCPGYKENEDTPYTLATQCEKCDEEPDPETTETHIRHGQEHRHINGEWLIRDKNTCAVRDYPEIVDDSSVEEIALSHGNGTYAVEVSVSPFLQPSTWNIDLISRIK